MTTFMTRTVGNYTVSDDPSKLDVQAMHAYLRRAYWSEEIPLEIVERAARNSLCIAAYDATGAQSGTGSLHLRLRHVRLRLRCVCPGRASGTRAVQSDDGDGFRAPETAGTQAVDVGDERCAWALCAVWIHACGASRGGSWNGRFLGSTKRKG